MHLKMAQILPTFVHNFNESLQYSTKVCFILSHLGPKSFVSQNYRSYLIFSVFSKYFKNGNFSLAVAKLINETLSLFFEIMQYFYSVRLG
jgi:hypothetical protein